MRELKFRQRLKESLWYKEEKFHYWGFIDDVFVSPVGKNDSVGESEQYTGLKDTDGKDIYDGDILSLSTNYRNYNCVIEWDDSLGSCGCCYDACESVGFVGRVLKGSNYTYSKLASGFNEMTIIGNIHENPELMENENEND